MATVAPALGLNDIGFKFGVYPVVGGDQAKPVHKIRVPKFESLEAERAHRKLHHAAALRWLGYNGYNNEGAGGHVTVRDPVHPDHFWYATMSELVLQELTFQDQPTWQIFQPDAPRGSVLCERGRRRD